MRGRHSSPGIPAGVRTPESATRYRQNGIDDCYIISILFNNIKYIITFLSTEIPVAGGRNND
ncbi:MAG: hypothetical protein ACRETM_10150, partial [Stenotrophobium sp.]